MSLSTAINTETITACVMALNFEMPQDGSAPEWIELLPAGQTIVGRDGRTWINDKPDSVLAAFAAEGKDLPIDWEHSSELKACKGEEAPAAAWIKQLEVRADGSTWARVEWTPRGTASVMNREYRYLSPVFKYDRSTGRVMRITSCGLTNQPNLFLDALNRAQPKEEPTMLKRLLLLLGMPETTSEEAALNHITSIKGDLATALNSAASPPLDKFVPKGDYDLALNRATDAEGKLTAQAKATLETAINSEIKGALKLGKITPGTKDYHVAQCQQEGGLDRFKAFVAAAPITAGDSNLDKKIPGATDTALNAEEQKVCTALGISEEDYRKANPA